MLQLENQYPIIKEIQKGNEVLWLNPKIRINPPQDNLSVEIENARKRMERFAPYIKKVFPETARDNGIIESELIEIPNMRKALKNESERPITGTLLLKCDSHLPISGSIKARGGIYEVLAYAEKIAIEHGELTTKDDYSKLADDKFQKLFSNYSVSVGSTGNLGLSIGMISSKLGLKVTVHMSADARQWKKDMLRERGVTVVEYDADYEKAVEEGRKQAEKDPYCHFIDDENSMDLFVGYAVAAKRLKNQLNDRKIIVDKHHPLFVYLPCGVGGGPGGVAYGLKQIFGENVHCFFAEPVQAPCMLLGVMTGLHNQISVHDIGLTGRTAADGLAVGRPSKLVGKTVGNQLDGIFTVNDDHLFRLIASLAKEENIRIEPSAAAGFPGYAMVQNKTNLLEKIGQRPLENSTHIVWATGGSLVPNQEMNDYLEKGYRLKD